ncbi:MAG: sulfurtransferase TusA family protein [Gammaproteobacteria bacterium]|jgi:tRNA 2-thiouridine synthesizing protein A
MGLFGRSKDKGNGQAGSSLTLGNGDTVEISQIIDCLGDSCPRPQLMTKKAMSKAASGDVIEVRIDNPTSMEAIPPMMPELEGTHLETIKTDRYWQVIVQKN